MGTTYIPDLLNNADGKNGLVGDSYEVAGFFNASKRKTEKNLSGYTVKANHAATAPEVTLGRPISPSETWIIYDADDQAPTGATPADLAARKNGDYPDIGDNHGAAGGNVVFCDGHAAWISQKNYLVSWAVGTDETHPALNP